MWVQCDSNPNVCFVSFWKKERKKKMLCAFCTNRMRFMYPTYHIHGCDGVYSLYINCLASPLQPKNQITTVITPEWHQFSFASETFSNWQLGWILRVWLLCLVTCFFNDLKVPSLINGAIASLLTWYIHSLYVFIVRFSPDVSVTLPPRPSAAGCLSTTRPSSIGCSLLGQSPASLNKSWRKVRQCSSSCHTIHVCPLLIQYCNRWGSRYVRGTRVLALSPKTSFVLNYHPVSAALFVCLVKS